MLLPFSSCVFVPFLFSLFLSVSPIFIWWMGLGLLRGCRYWTRSACGDWLIPWWNVGHWCLFLVTLAEGKPRYGNRHPAKIQLQILGAVSRLRGMSAGLLYFKFCWFNSSMIFVYETKKKSGNTSVDICFSFSVLGVCDDRVLDGVIYAVWDSGARGKGNECTTAMRLEKLWFMFPPGCCRSTLWLERQSSLQLMPIDSLPHKHAHGMLGLT